MMVFVNEAITWTVRPVSVLRTFLQILAPFAPHLAEELWARLHVQAGTAVPSLSYAPWPAFDPALLVEDEIELPVQVNGKVRARIQPLIKYTGSTDGAPTVTVVVRVGPDGTVLSKRVTRASGRPEWDAAVLRAIDAAITIPKDVDGRIPQVVMSEGLELTFTP